MQLGGFDSILSPFYWEDVDLSYRAWKRGWKIIYEPRSMLYHYHRSTISKAFNPNYIAFIGERNRYLVVWKNIFDCGFLLQYILFIPLRLARNLFKGKLVLVFAFFAALGRFRIVLKRREIEKQEAKRTDKEIFALFNPKNKTEKGIFKVLYIDEWGDIHGGGQIYSLSLLKKIDRNKFIPVFVCPSPGTFVDALEEEGVKVEIIKMKSLRNPLNILSFISSTIKITALIKKEKVDFIYSSGAARGTIYAGIAAKIMKIPLIWHVHILNSTGLLNRILACLSTKIIIIAEAGHKRFSWVHDPTKVVTNYNGIDLQKFNPNNIDNMSIKREFGLSPDIILVGTVGILHPQKGQKYLLEIVKQIKAEISDIKFLIVGNDPTKDARHRRELESLTRELGIAKDVIFTGWRQDIPKIMAGLDIFVLPSLVDHLPLVVLEAMASGKPVVATNVGGVFEMVEDRVTGILVPPGDSESLRRAIIGLLKDKEKAKRMGMAGRRRTEEFFNIEANAKIIEQVYRDLLGKTP
jgi:glycosyltransferase involved in cell wall biosynthesis